MSKSFKEKIYPALNANLTVDTAIVGGGLAGISTAYFLAKAGKSAAVFESAAVGSGATSKTTAFITQLVDTSISDLLSMFGPKKTKLIWESHGKAVETIEK